MEMRKNKVKEKLLRGECSVGVWHEIGHPDIAEMQAMTGWDFMVYEMEHAPISLESVQNCIQVADRYGTVPIIRIPANDPVHFKMCLDIGAQGLIVPMVNTAAETRQAVRSTRYPPTGIRGYGPRRGAMYGSFEDDYYARFADENLLLFVQIETQESLDNLDEIASVEGFLFEDIHACPGQLTAAQGIVKGGVVNNPSAGHVDQVRRRLHQPESPGVHEVMRLLRVRDVNGDHIASGDHAVHVFKCANEIHLEFIDNILRDLSDIHCLGSHIKGLGSLSQRTRTGAKADQSERHAIERMAGRIAQNALFD